MREDYVLFPGEILKIPVAPPPAIEPVIAPTVVLYIVQPGDTLSRIATRFRVDLRRILADNPHVRRTPDLIYPGQIIYINYAGLV
ncbi:MAG: LysM peptidoglycan-binding domain-containing protein [Clostridia bacterium]|nr:LysM peptidoglycan-binding domain-containing protein [Clostridia bacterium]